MDSFSIDPADTEPLHVPAVAKPRGRRPAPIHCVQGSAMLVAVVDTEGSRARPKLISAKANNPFTSHVKELLSANSLLSIADIKHAHFDGGPYLYGFLVVSSHLFEEPEFYDLDQPGAIPLTCLLQDAYARRELLLDHTARGDSKYFKQMSFVTVPYKAAVCLDEPVHCDRISEFTFGTPLADYMFNTLQACCFNVAFAK